MPEINALAKKTSNLRLLTTTVYAKFPRLYRTQSCPWYPASCAILKTKAHRCSSHWWQGFCIIYHESHTNHC